LVKKHRGKTTREKKKKKKKKRTETGVRQGIFFLSFELNIYMCIYSHAGRKNTKGRDVAAAAAAAADRQ
jgi:hypothetical protein